VADDEDETSTPKIQDPRRDPTLPPRTEQDPAPREGTRGSPIAITQKLASVNPENLLVEEIRIALAKVNQGMQGVHEDVKGLHDTLRQNADQSLDAHEQTRKHVDRLAVNVVLNMEMTRTLWTHSFGDRPPPKPPESGQSLALLEHPSARIPRPSERGVVKTSRASDPAVDAAIAEHKRQITDHDGLIYSLKGEIIAVDAQVKEILNLQKRQMGIRETKDERVLLRRLADALLSRQNQKFVLLMVGAITGLVTACGTTYALVTGRLPLPSSHFSSPAIKP
jgi:hypothetical protein